MVGHSIVSSRLDYANALLYDICSQHPRCAGCAELTGQSNLSGFTVSQCNRITSAASVRCPSVLDFPGQSFISGSCPGFHGVLDLSWIWSLLSSDPSLENVYLSQYYVHNVRLLTAMTKWVIPVTVKSQWFRCYYRAKNCRIRTSLVDSCGELAS